MAGQRASSVLVLVAVQLLLVVKVSSSAVPRPSTTEAAEPSFALVGRGLQSSPSLGSNSVTTANLAAGTTTWTLTTSTSLMYVAVLSTGGDAKTIQSFTCGASPTAQVYNMGSSNYVTAGATPAWFYGYGVGSPSQQGWVSMGFNNLPYTGASCVLSITQHYNAGSVTILTSTTFTCNAYHFDSPGIGGNTCSSLYRKACATQNYVANTCGNCLHGGGSVGAIPGCPPLRRVRRRRRRRRRRRWGRSPA